MTNIQAYTHRNRDWTAERIQSLKELHALGLSASKIGLQLGATRNSIIGKISRLGLSSRENPDPWTPAEIDCLKQQRALGLNDRDISAVILVRCGTIKSPGAVSAKADRLRLTKRMAIKAQIRRGIVCEYEPAPDPADFTPLKVHLMQLGHRHCREIVGHGMDGLALYCGHPIKDRSFCAVHFRVNYYKAQPMRRAW